ncbi:uncharacterized protein BT62DRAFT_1041564 [Guyanagaster necrorhizus]|uniref:Uncharacterized protein n=1 Tax=Guyanagaster necrorhizus TaxID=856835 RepID=A0A9P7VIV4_9AGAR|nr:uncharacterized protein BT62DRAFT_1041564 [Guyanagaster necrorhizus MCA 3950]KAG7441901.1 hypothetical protein BT62DRAFT_1041564 [Guyanagaster necrorhizus MCA 3950]
MWEDKDRGGGSEARNKDKSWCHHSYSGFVILPIWCEPACPCEFLEIFHESYGTSIWSSHECSDSSTCSRNIFYLTIAFRLERTIETNQPPVPLWPRKNYRSNRNRKDLGQCLFAESKLELILSQPARTETQHISERDVPGVAERSRSASPGLMQTGSNGTRWNVEYNPGNWMSHRDCTSAMAHVGNYGITVNAYAPAIFTKSTSNPSFRKGRMNSAADGANNTIHRGPVGLSFKR